MNKKDVDIIVMQLMEETNKYGCVFSKEELKDRFKFQYSHDQIERIYHRYIYLRKSK